MKSSNSVTLFTILLLVFSAGCAKQETAVDSFHGTSYELAKQSQLYNPQAGMHKGPPVGLEGTVGTRVIERYESGFEKPAAQTNIYSITTSGVEVK